MPVIETEYGTGHLASLSTSKCVSTIKSMKTGLGRPGDPLLEIEEVTGYTPWLGWLIDSSLSVSYPSSHKLVWKGKIDCSNTQAQHKQLLHTSYLSVRKGYEIRDALLGRRQEFEIRELIVTIQQPTSNEANKAKARRDEAYRGEMRNAGQSFQRRNSPAYFGDISSFPSPCECCLFGCERSLL